MKLWILRPIETNADNPWEPWCEKTFGFVVRAETESEARQFAADNGGEEVLYGSTNPWLDPKYSVCFELTNEGEPGVVIGDHHSA